MVKMQWKSADNSENEGSWVLSIQKCLPGLYPKKGIADKSPQSE